MTRPPVSDDVQAYVYEIVKRALAVEHDTRERNFQAWILGRAASIAQTLSIELVGDCPDCGAVPLREADDVTQPILVTRTETAR